MLGRVASFALALAVAGCEQQPGRDQAGNLVGPVYTSERLNRQGLAGVQPGMPLSRAAAILAAQGYAPMPRSAEDSAGDSEGVIKRRYFWIPAAADSEAARFPQLVRLSYALRESGAAEVTAIGQFRRITPQERGDAEGSRRSVVQRHGRPSLWRQDFYRGELWDEMDYVASPALRNQENLAQLRACHADWQCEKVAKKFDCRETMRNGRETGLRISWAQEGNRVYYELSDYRRQHDAQLRAGKLASLSLRGAFCAVESFDGFRTMVAHPE